MSPFLRGTMARWREHRGRLHAFVGRQFDGGATVVLSDGEGRPRLRRIVDSLGAAGIEFLGDSGEVIKRIGAEE